MKGPPMMGFFHRDAKGNETPVAVENAIDDDAGAATGTAFTTGSNPATQTESSELAKLRAELAARDQKIEEDRARIKALETAAIQERVAAVRASSVAFADKLVTSSKLLPAGREHLANLHAFAHLSAAGLPAEGIDPVASVAGLVSGLVPHNLTAEALGDENALANGGATFRVNNGSTAGPGTPEARMEKASSDLEKYYARQGIKPRATG